MITIYWGINPLQIPEGIRIYHSVPNEKADAPNNNARNPLIQHIGHIFFL